MKRLLIGMIRFYQRRISPHTPPACRFQPTCSQYALTALQRYGFWKGGGMALWRLVRCNPFCKGGYDPVPEVPNTTLRRN
ncbi:MAG: membrane protein insertion efficiency factor YidD [Candidatus Limiplasma sp.]|nr:membrane protein insertion efficiency factor YidD [Candidatus Limiplasma sp.]